MKNTIIIFEGPNYVGKTFFSKKMKELIEEKYNQEVVIFREPGSTEAAEKIRQILFDHPELEDITKTLLFTACRYEAYNKEVYKELEAGKIVIMDRSMLSTLVYQKDTTAILKISKVLMDQFNYIKAKKIMCILDADTELLNKRRKERGITKSFDTINSDELRSKYKRAMFAIEKMLIPMWDTSAMVKITDDNDANIKTVSEYIFEQLDNIKEMDGE